MIGKRLVSIHFPVFTKDDDRRKTQVKIHYEKTDSVFALVRLIYPRVDVLYGERSKTTIFGPVVLSEKRIQQLRRGNCMLVSDETVYRIDEVDLLSRRRNAINIRCLEDARFDCSLDFLKDIGK